MSRGRAREWILAISLGASGAASAQPLEAPASLLERNLELGAAVAVEWAPTLHSGPSQMFQMSFVPELDAELPLGMSLRAVGRLRSDGCDELEPGDPDLSNYSRLSRPDALGERTEAELRELYLDGRVGNAFLRIGKQQIVWGEADGLKMLDIVDPQDYREFILDDFEDSRIPLWAANVEVVSRWSSLQLLFVPDPTRHQIPGLDEVEPDGAYAPTAPMFRPEPPVLLGEPVVIDFDPASRPRWRMRYADLGARLSTVVAGWDLSLAYLYHTDDFPVFRHGSGGIRLIDNRFRIVVPVEPAYERKTLVGGTFSRSLGSLTLRGEVASSLDRAYTTVLFSDADGIVRRNELGYVVGLDWFGFRDTFLSVQFFQTVILDHDPAMIREERDTTLTFVARRTFRSERFYFEFTALHGLRHADGLVRPALGYRMRDAWDFRIGADVFYGSAHGPFGQYDANDRMLVGIEWRI